MNSLIIISNEKFYMDEKACYCDNIEMKSTPEELSNIYEVLLIARKFNIKRAFDIFFIIFKINYFYPFCTLY